ncbi:MAG: type II toxin-antitoxin system RelE/ParE family toxin [Bacteroidales bacterium]|nr:type II toxin-antitoxin system RelE/ParE family toxin [Bacteroidales bacterium]
MDIRWSEKAATEFADTISYVSQEFGQHTAQKIRNSIVNSIGIISQFPNAGKVSFIDEKKNVEFHELPSKFNSIIYSIYNDNIYIVSIWSNRRNRAKLYALLKSEANNL